jgi:hypothetical protein
MTCGCGATVRPRASWNLRFENVRPQRSTSDNKAVNYMLAGAAERTPVASVSGGHYYRYSGDRLIGEASRPPTETPGQQPVTVTDLGRYREYHVYKLQVNTVLAVTRANEPPETWVMDWLDVSVDVGPAPTGPGAITNPAAAKMDAAQLLNPQIDGAYLSVLDTNDWASLEQWAHWVNGAIDAGASVGS